MNDLACIWIAVALFAVFGWGWWIPLAYLVVMGVIAALMLSMHH